MLNIEGTSGKIKVTKTSDYNFNIDIDETYGGQVSLNTVGVLTTGLWQAELIQPEFGGTGVANSGTIATQANISFTGAINFNANVYSLSNVKIIGSGTMAFKENSLQTLNCFAEFNAEQQSVAFDNISPLRQRGQILSHNGKKNIAVDIGSVNQFLGICAKTGVPQYQDLPNIYSYIVNDSTNNYSTTFLPLRRILNFASDAFVISDCDSTKRTLVRLDQSLESIVKSNSGLLVKVNDDQEHACKSYFALRSLQAGQNISIKNANFIDGDPMISISKNYQGQSTITTLGNIKHGSWQADIIAPKYGGTGCANKHKIELGADVSINVQTEIEGLHGGEKLSIGVYHKGVHLIAEESGSIATKHRTLQCVNNLTDIQHPAEAFRHISPTQSKGDIIVRGPKDWDIALSAPNIDNKIIVSSTGSICGLTYKSIGELDELHSIIKSYVDAALGTILKNTEKLDDYVQRLGKVEKLLDDVCSQLDHMIKTKQIKPVKQLDDAMKAWSNLKIKKQS